MAYLPHSDGDRAAMLAAVGAATPRDLFAAVPRDLLDPPLDLPPPLGEQELVGEMERLAGRNRPLGSYASFLGGGVYHRFIPAIVRATVSRPEFYTAYTPYQAEASQGTLQTIFEFQSMMCALTGMEVANASLYDGATAAAEAALLAVAHTGRDRVLVSGGLHPDTLRVLRTYGEGRGMELDLLPRDTGQPAGSGAAAVTDRHAAVVISQPTFRGAVEDLRSYVDAAHAVGALAIVALDPIAAAVLATPGDIGADVVVGDCQQLGIPASFGGPHCGYLAVRQSLVRRMPGRLVGLTQDATGRRAFTLTLQTREQHIRRERATSNICTNHALMALAATTYMAHMGGGGLRRLAELSTHRMHHLVARLEAATDVHRADSTAPFLFETTLRLPMPAQEFCTALRDQGIVAGLPLATVGAGDDQELLVACTELTPPSAIDAYVSAAQAALTRTTAGVGV